MKKFIKFIIPIFILLMIYIYILAIDTIPNNITVFQGENINFRTLIGMKINGMNSMHEKEQSIEASNNKRR